MERAFDGLGPPLQVSSQAAQLEAAGAPAQRCEQAPERRQVVPEQGQEGRPRPEVLHEALEATRRENRVLAERLEAAKARLDTIVEWIETGRPRREMLRESAFARMRARLESLPVIEQAKGVVMAEQRCGPEEAFDLLRRGSQRANVKLHVLAAQIVGQVASPLTEASVQLIRPAASRHPFPGRTRAASPARPRGHEAGLGTRPDQPGDHAVTGTDGGPLR